jgi:diacylglycerol kinase
MSDPHIFPRRARGDDASPGSVPGAASGAASPEVVPEPFELPSGAELVDLESESELLGNSATDRRGATTRDKLAEGAQGIKLAIRAESSFFAHAYRGLLIAISAAILDVSPTGWCFLLVSAALVLLAETFRCGIIATLRAVAPPGDPDARIAEQIATGGLLFASITSGCLTIAVLGLKLGELLGW